MMIIIAIGNRPAASSENENHEGERWGCGWGHVEVGGRGGGEVAIHTKGAIFRGL